MEKYNHLDVTDQSHVESLLHDRTSAGSEDGISEILEMKYRDGSWFRRHKRSICFNFLLVLVNLIFCLAYTSWTQSKYSLYRHLPDSPARDIIRYEKKQLDLTPVYLANGTLNPEKPTNFNGKPTPEVAEAWKNLMQHQNARLQKEELGDFAEDDGVIQLSDGSGYFGTLAVFHGLHCVKRLHHYIHRDSYYPNLSSTDADRLLYHTEHCVDWLRQYVQCNADTTLIPFYWGTNQPSPLAVDQGRHQCVSWEPLEHWMAERSFHAFEPGLLMHPVFGNPYAKEKGDRIGIAVADHPLHSEGSAR